MGKVENALRDEIARLARREAKKLQSRSVEDIRRLKKRVAELQSEVAGMKKAQARAASRRRMTEAAREVGGKAAGRARLSPGLVKKLRKRLGDRQPEFAKLIGVSPAAVGFWESAKSQPRPEMKARIVALRKLGRRDVQRLLEAGKK